MLVDSHCHLDFPELASDTSAVVRRARESGVGLMVTISTTMKEFSGVLAIAERHNEVLCSVGVHPEHVADAGENVSAGELIRIAAHPKVVGIGETGLDYHYDGPPHDIQKKLFREHLRAAAHTGLPVIVHSRDAEDDTVAIMREEMEASGGKLTGLMHCFSSDKRLADAALEMGFYISFSGIITFKKSMTLREIARGVPLDRLLVETDSPFLSPEPHRGKTCEPAYVVHTAKVLADVHGIGVGEMENSTTENFFRLFRKANAP